jgi:GT2 family glycosyltransferase
MADQMTDKKTPNKPSAMPVIYVHAKGHEQASKEQVQSLLEPGLPVCCHLAYENVTRTENGYDQAGLLLAELAELFPGNPIIFIRAGLQPSRNILDELTLLLQRGDQPLALSLLSNAEVALNPFSGLQAPASDINFDHADLVQLLAPGNMHELTDWPDHFVMLSAELVSLVCNSVQTGTWSQQLKACKGRLMVADHLFLHDPDRPVFKPLKLAPHETACPPPFGELSARLQDWFDADIADLPIDIHDAKPATLHITHSWGGGVAQWLKSFIETDQGQRHFQLRSEGPQSGHGYGQRLCLYAGNELGCPIASWWLQPSIASVTNTHATYRQVLSEIIPRFGIGRVMVSSLVGHSLDALRSGLPALQILHDHFPTWPLLSVNPRQYLRKNGPPKLELALQEHVKNREFPDIDAHAWSRIRDAYLEALSTFNIKIAAPAASVMELQVQLEPKFRSLGTEIIPHGFPTMQNLQAITPRPRKDGRLRLVIIGRMQTGKGQQLLIRALPELARHVHVYLLGSGKSGEAFFGMSGINIQLEYERDQLPAILKTIGPDFAALLSIVPETFSYTLSELQLMQIPVIANRVGSFIDRVEHGKTGWLIAPDATALIKQVAELCGAPEQIESVRENLHHIKAISPEEMVTAYNRLCPRPHNIAAFVPTETELEQDQQGATAYSLAMVSNQLQQALEKQSQLQKEIKQRTNWALETERQLKLEQKQREEWVERLESEIIRLQDIISTQHRKLDRLESEYQRLESNFQRVTETNSLIMNSTSWKITRPLRAGRRIFKNFMLARTWNPARWPWLLSQLVKNLSTLGFAGTLKRMQYTGVEAVPEPHLSADLEAIGDHPAPAAFPVHENPHVSIVIPVHNHWPYTAACLRSLLETSGKRSFEVIVVDDKSSDETATHLAQIEGLTILQNETNMGFVASCNRGASQAQGEYLVLLNNDIQVLEGWLDELIDTFEREPRAGLVGARLIYPDGSLQESGGIVFSDGSGWNYGRGKEAENPQYLFLRETDYCSGACIALRTRFFHQIGALDERYSPAYYEDTDLAFRVREAGFKVLIQPLSAVVHHEGITSGTDTSIGMKKYQVINQKKFTERWKKELESQPEKISDPDDPAAILRASQHRFKGHILFIDANTPEPDKDSGSVRLTNLMQCCRELGYGVTFLPHYRGYAGTYTRALQMTGVEVLYDPWLGSLHDLFRDRGSEFDYVFISRHYIAINYISLLKRWCPDARFVFDTVDLHYLREQRLAEMEQSTKLKHTAEQTRRSEMSVIRAADATLVVSTVEKTVLETEAPGEKVHVVSNIHLVPGRDKAFADRKDIYFVGGYQHPPNVDAACWFVNDIWPLIHAQLPQMRCHLIGSNAPDEVRALNGDGVIFHGFVESLQPYLSDCRLAVAPLRYGAGVKGKVNMSMAHGQPVVATPAAAEGMFAEHERELLIAENAESFAHQVVRLYQDDELWNRLSDASVQNVENHFSMAAARESLAALFDSFGKR